MFCPSTIASHDVKSLAKAVEATTNNWQSQVFKVGAARTGMGDELMMRCRPFEAKPCGWWWRLRCWPVAVPADRAQASAPAVPIAPVRPAAVVAEPAAAPARGCTGFAAGRAERHPGVACAAELETTLVAQMVGRISALNASLVRVPKGRRTIVSFDCSEASARLQIAQADTPVPWKRWM